MRVPERNHDRLEGLAPASSRRELLSDDAEENEDGAGVVLRSRSGTGAAGSFSGPRVLSSGEELLEHWLAGGAVGKGEEGKRVWCSHGGRRR